MTRAEAKKLVTECVNKSHTMTIEDFEADTIIDAIYESRREEVCINCANFQRSTERYLPQHKCRLKVEAPFDIRWFGCNKFARK